jgi:transcriptional regulator with XRE-family HTH domain
MSSSKDNDSSVQPPAKETHKTELKKKIGARVREIRKNLGYTQDRMVEYFDCGRANYSRIEKGEVFPNPAMLKGLNQEFKVSLHWLVCGKGEMLENDNHYRELKLNNTDSGEINELLVYIEKVPMVRHAILSYFLEYIEKNKALIAPSLKEKNIPN